MDQRLALAVKDAFVKRTLHLISDSTGETVANVASAVLALYDAKEVEEKLHVFVRSAADVDGVIAEIKANPGLVFITMVDQDRKQQIISAAAELGVEAIPVLHPAIESVGRFLGAPAAHRPGGQYAVDALYFRRVDAIDYAINHDDGALGDRLSKADVILTGVSRTSKTPTCIYLACRGVKAANLPLVPGSEPPSGFFEAIESGVPVIALTASPSRLSQIRTQRLETIGHDKDADYAALDTIRSEVADARLLFERIGAPIIDVTRRSIEETAAAIMAILRSKGRL